MNPHCEPTHKDPVINVQGVEKKPWDLKTTLPEDQVEVNRNLVKGKAGSPGLQGGEDWSFRAAFLLSGESYGK